MTITPTDADREAAVTQADREAAAGCYDELTGKRGRTNPDEMRGDWLAHRMCRHRTTATAALEAENERLREALKPFASNRASDRYLASGAPDDAICAAYSFTAGDYRRAKTALAKGSSHDG